MNMPENDSPATERKRQKPSSPFGHPKTKDSTEQHIFQKPYYVLSFNFETKLAFWIFEILTFSLIPPKRLKDAKKQGFESRNTVESNFRKFKEDPDFQDLEGARTDDFIGWPKESYEKGHLAPAGNHRYTKEAFESTFLYSNIVPMRREVNENLVGIEEEVRNLATKFGKVICISGPYFYPENEKKYVIESSTVPIPDAIFKVILHEIKVTKKNQSKKYFVRVYIVRNSNDGLVKKIKLKYLEFLTGLIFFPDIPMYEIKERKISKNSMEEYVHPWNFLAFIQFGSNTPRKEEKPEIDSCANVPEQRKPRNIGQ